MSGITDEAAIEGHDLIHQAELEEERMHESDNAPHSDASQAVPSPTQTKYPDTSPRDPHDTPQSQHKESTLDKIKEALHIK
ncbi:uncharacterized protein P174DRAFT_444946 [Aspergillus novofumigatus IBT 16806]|uniref:Uncharacterized protein n=1 Tax=Aspergillus novofumigatus (strain IBT 16806) TaxID=1392255 RepID=A0A2I1C0X4_ASPN1|nr:uncharacterized protein P174DRAFT_444946 [Aspergillus novofumigatus IBT 16806]PKX91245.1 hypothetical protein P174DRAFT_444946 [Aspergillus novofumigatus IBT 16806]